MSYFVRCRTVNEGNVRSSWRKRAKRAKDLRALARMHTDLAVCSVSLPITITLTRIGACKLDSDGVPSALKAIRDGVADSIGIDDGRDDLIDWQYKQEFGARLVHGVRIEIKQRERDNAEER